MDRNSVISYKESWARYAGLLALAFAGFQIALALVFAPGPDLRTRYLKLNNWDSQHYGDIVRRGYQLSDPVISSISSDDVHSDRSNVAFFPAFPLAARTLGSVLSISAEISLLVVSQFFCVVFWYFFFLLVARAGVTMRSALGMGALALCYPTAFFLVMGYSESMFMAALLGLLYWCERALAAEGSLGAWLLAGVFGAILSASRLVGAPWALYPVLCVFVFRKWARIRVNIGGAILASVLACLGVGSFFLWCQTHFGAWDLYLTLQKRGWNNIPDYLALIKPMSYVPRFFFEDTMDSISRVSVPISIYFIWRGFLGLNLKVEPSRGALLFSTATMFYVSLSGKANANMDSMSRYTFPVFILCGLGLLWKKNDADRGAQFVLLSKTGIWVALVTSFALQCYMSFMFLRGHWVA